MALFGEATRIDNLLQERSKCPLGMNLQIKSVKMHRFSDIEKVPRELMFVKPNTFYLVSFPKQCRLFFLCGFKLSRKKVTS